MTPMNNIIAPIAVEVITAGQIGRASDRFSERCRTNAVSLPKDIVQEVLEHEGDQIAQEMFEALRSHVERRASMIVRRVTVDRTITSQQALDATGRKQYTDQGIVDEAAVIGGKVADEDLYIFKPDASAFDEHGLISDDNLERQFELRGLNPTDLYQIAGLNKADSAFADEKPNGTHW